MKRSLFILLLLTTGLTTATKAQNVFFLKELEKLASGDSTAFDRYVIKKGYILSNASSETIKIYSSKNQRANKKHDVIDRIYTGSGPAVISFSTTDSIYYKQIQDSLIHNGFKNTGNESVSVGEGTIVITRHYANKEFTVDLVPNLPDVGDYDVKVMKKPQ